MVAAELNNLFAAYAAAKGEERFDPYAFTRYRVIADLRPLLRDDALYLGDGGRCFCGRLHHARIKAHFTGRDRSGQTVHRVTEADQREARRMGVSLACETCTADARRAARP